MSNLISQLPADFATLEPFVAKWALGTAKQRHSARLDSTKAELQAFYDAILPEMRKLLAALDQFALGTLPEDLHKLYWLSLSFAEIAPHIELYKGSIGVPYAFEEKRFVYETGEVVNV
jgi:hypothetical protein